MQLTRRGVWLIGILSGLTGSACYDPQLLETRLEPKGQNCPGGGNAVLGGADANHNGKLDAQEVSSTTYVCNGVDGANGKDGVDGKTSLIQSKSEGIGSACPTGGAKYSTGLDLDADGVLGEDEVTNVRFICNGAPGKDGAAGLDSLIQLLTLDPGSGDSCPNGGQAIYSGRDLDGDGLLDPVEVEQTAFVCNARDGESALVRQAPEEPGANCEFGGVRLDSGLDTDGDGALVGSEVTQTSYVCRGAPGAAAHSTVVAVVEEPPGENCAAGGARVDSGLDLDGDGLLASTEVTGTSYICSGAESPGNRSGTGNLLQRLRWAPAACDEGGVRVDSGLDADGSGVLEDSEVTGTAYECNTVLPWSRNGIAVGDAHACAPQSDGGVSCWGSNSDGQLGDGTSVTRAEPSSSVPGLPAAAFVATGGKQSCAIVAGGVRCWGRGLLGNATQDSSATPVVVVRMGGGHPPSSSVPFDGAVALSLGESHSCALRTDGTVWCWGDGTDGQLGHWYSPAGGQRAQVVVVSMPGGTFANLTGAVAIASGGAHSCALLSSGQVYCWGAQSEGQLGNDTPLSSPSALPVRVSALGTDAEAALTNVVAIDAGGAHSCAVLKDGTVRCWGRNDSGELGTGDTLPLRFASNPVPGVTTARALAAGLAHSCALLHDATVRCWGANQAGQLGNGTFDNSLLPVPASTQNIIAAIDAGPRGATTCARLIDGRAQCWGAGGDGELGKGLPAQDSPVPDAVLSIH
jgi:alpha-tubulin suppressor-like RCC1 family protein